MTTSRRMAGAIAVAVLVAACSSAGATPAPSVGGQPSAAPAGSAMALTINVQQGSLGAYLTSPDGKALYLLTKDSSGTSTCTGQCAAAWPPLTLQAGETVVAGTGVSGTLSTIKRPDGSDQVAINGLPLYNFSGDTAAGQTNGQGYNNVWFLASPSGTTVGSAGASPAASPASTKSGGGGYGY